MDLFDIKTGERLYLNAEERKRFFAVASVQENDKKYFALMLYYTGCRLNEALSLNVGSFDLSNDAIIICSLKKKEKVHYRHIPLPSPFVEGLTGAYKLRTRRKNQKNHKNKIWNFSDRTARRYVVAIMKEAGITGKKACPKGLRHSFGVHAVEKKIPITEIQKLLGHQHLETTRIYTNVMEEEKRALVSRMWE